MQIIYRKYSILAGLVVSVVLLLIAMMYYPGGSYFQPESEGFDWKYNYLSNLFSPHAVNGAINISRYWAIAAMFFLCLSFGLFFISFSRKIAVVVSSRIIGYGGAGAMVFVFLAVTPYHDVVLRVANVLVLLSLFYITVHVFKAKLVFAACLSVICMLLIYICSFIYFTQIYLMLLPVLQKVSLIFLIVWVVTLEYFTHPGDFELPEGASIESGKV